MNNSPRKNSIAIYFAGLEAKERMIFDRVIAFNVAHGLVSHICDNAESADLIVSTEDTLGSFEGKLEKQKVLILSNDIACSVGDVQLKRPILITRVMKALETAVNLVKLDQDNQDVIDTSAENTADIVKADLVTDEKESTHAQAVSEILESGHHALIIDDSAAIRKQLELELRDAGISSDFAESGEQALEKIEDNQYDIVFLDIIMPGIDGYETCRAIRTKASYKRTPIIMLSGKTSPLDEVQGVIAGATTYLTKPVKSAMLQETLGRVTKWLNNFAVTDKKKKSTVV